MPVSGLCIIITCREITTESYTVTKLIGDQKVPLGVEFKVDKPKAKIQSVQMPAFVIRLDETEVTEGDTAELSVKVAGKYS